MAVRSSELRPQFARIGRLRCPHTSSLLFLTKRGFDGSRKFWWSRPITKKDGGYLWNGPCHSHDSARRGIGAGERRGGRRQAVACWEWPRASSERAWSRMQHHYTAGLDRNEGRHFTVSAARLAHESSSGRACPATEIR